MITYEGIILWSWAAFLLVWVVSSFGVKRDIRGGRASIFAPPPALGWTAAVMTATGIGLAIWARAFIGRNWSPRPAMKEHHELVTTGPYAYVRHPIYSGILLATLGTALTGTVFGIGMFVFTNLIFLSRIGREEKIMLELFPNEYPAYQTRTKRLVPSVW